MSAEKLNKALRTAKLNKHDRKWFELWVGWYGQYCRANSPGRIPVERDLVIGFLRQQKSKGRKAWQRLQAVRAIEFYRTTVLRMSEPDLQDIRATLAKFVERQRRAAGPGEGEQDIDVVGQIGPNEPDVIQNMRRQLRVLGKKWKTEKAYVGWAKRFIKYVAAEDLSGLEPVGDGAIQEFLTDLAVERNVAAKTQNQALNALLFLFRHVLNREPGYIDAVRASGPRRLPVVLTHGEIDAAFEQLGGCMLLIAQLLYGAGLRLSDGLRLRVKDVDFDVVVHRPSLANPTWIVVGS